MFSLGQTVMTSGIAHECKKSPAFSAKILDCLGRYTKGDWGDLCEDDKKLNDDAVKTGDDRILAAYIVGKKVYIITEYDRSVTTVLFADEY